MEGSTVKQLLDALNDMKAIYPYDNDKTFFHTHSPVSLRDDVVSIHTIDENTGIVVELTKPFKGRE